VNSGGARSFVPQTNVSLGGEGNMTNPASTKRPTVGGVSYTPSGPSNNNTNASASKRNVPVTSLKREDSISNTRKASEKSALSTVDSNISDGEGFTVSAVRISPPKTMNSETSASAGSGSKNSVSGNFDDSDEENPASTKKAASQSNKRTGSAKRLSFDDRTSSDEGLGVQGIPATNSGHNSARKDSGHKAVANSTATASNKPVMKPLAGSAAPPGAQAIPVKVFSVDF
jgi:hypothetical protein